MALHHANNDWAHNIYITQILSFNSLVYSNHGVQTAAREVNGGTVGQFDL